VIIVPKNNLYLPRRSWPSRRDQRGSIILAALGPAGLSAAPAIATLSASNNDVYTSQQFDPATNRPVAGWRANTNGNAEHDVWDTGGSAIWEASMTTPDWLTSGLASQFELQAVEFSQSGTATRLGTLNSFGTLTSTFTYSIEKSTTSVGTTQWVLDIEIREILNTSNTVSARITLNADIVI